VTILQPQLQALDLASLVERSTHADPGASVTFSTVFAPHSVANASGSITVGSEPLTQLSPSHSLARHCSGQLTLTPTQWIWQSDCGPMPSGRQPQCERDEHNHFVGRSE